MKFKNIGKRVLVNILSILLVINPIINSTAIAGEQNNNLTSNEAKYKKTIEKLDKIWSLLEELRSTLDRTQFDVDALLERLDYNPDKIINFVINDIYYEQYKGLLRGAKGTLMSRSGNALDQSVLLGKLLNDAGLEARIVRATLAEEQSKKLLSTMLDKRNKELPIGDKQEIKKVLSTIAKLANLSDDKVNSVIEEAFGVINPPSKLIKKANREADYLIGLLGADNLKNNSEFIKQKIIVEAKDYFYIEYRLSASEKWKSVHPIDSHLYTQNWKFLNKEYIKGSVPDNLQHRFRFEVFMEQQIGKKTVVHPLFKHWERPSANMNGVVLSYSNMPSNLEDFLRKPDSSLFKLSNMYLPILNYELAPGAVFFDKKGNSIDQLAGSSSMASNFQTIGNKFGDAISSLDSESKIRLNKVWMKFTLITPDGKQEIFKRTILELTKGQTISAEDLGRKLTAQNTFALAMGEMPSAFTLDKQLQKLISLRLPIEDLLAKKYNIRPPKHTDLDLRKVDFSWDGHATLYNIFDQNIIKSSEARQYRHKPSLVIHTIELPLWNKITETMDIVSNKRRSIVASVEDWSISPVQLLKRGVWETVTEGVLLRENTKLIRFNTMKSIESAKTQNIPIITIRPDEVSQVNRFIFPIESKQAITRDLKFGYTVIMPKSLPEGDEKIGWWRVNMSTGEALGMGNDGKGEEIATYTTLDRLIAGVVVGVLVGIACFGISGAVNANYPGTITLGDCVGSGLAASIVTGMGVTVEAGVTFGILSGLIITVISKLVDGLTD